MPYLVPGLTFFFLRGRQRGKYATCPSLHVGAVIIMTSGNDLNFRENIIENYNNENDLHMFIDQSYGCVPLMLLLNFYWHC